MQTIRRDVQLAITGAVFVLLAWHLVKDIDSVQFHGDESWWVTSSYYYSRLMLNQDFAVKDWMDPTKRGWNDILNMPIGKYFIGFAMMATLPKGEYFYDYQWERSFQENQALGNVPTLEVLRPGRLMSALISFFASLLMFAYCKRTWNWIVGCMAAVIFAFNPIFSLAAKRVMTDSFFLFFFILCQLIGANILLQAKNSKRFLILCAAAGVTAGLCASVKVNGLVLLLQYFVLMLFLICVSLRDREQVKRCAGGFAIILASWAVVTVVVNPFLYSWSPFVIVQRYHFILSRWNAVFARHQVEFAASGIHGFPWIVFQRVFKDYFPLPLTVCLAIGVCVSVKSLIDGLRGGSVPVVLSPLIFFFVSLVFFAAFIPMDWDRYYLPLLCAEVPLAAFGLWWIIENCARLVAARTGRARNVAS